MKPTPEVTTLQDIRDKKDLLIWGDAHILSPASNISNLNITDITKRINQNKIPKMPHKMVEEAINGRAVLLLSSIQMKLFKEITKNHQEKIFVSDSKYLPNYGSYIIDKNKYFSTIIDF